MSKTIIILRGINVSGKNKIRMSDLRNLLVEGGYKNIQTYIQSGNIILNDNERDPQQNEYFIHNLIQQKYGYDIPVISRSADEMQHIMESNPYLSVGNEITTSKEKELKETVEIIQEQLYVIFLKRAPASEELAYSSYENSGPDSFIFRGKEIFLHCPGGYGRTRFNNNFFEKRLKVTATTRNWKTILKLTELSGSND